LHYLGKADEAKYELKWMKKVNKFHLPWSVVLSSQSTTRFGCPAAVCLSDDVQECLWSQEATDEVWICLKQNIIDSAVNEQKNHFHTCVCTIGWQTILLQAVEKQKKLNEISAKMSKMWTKYVFEHYFDEVIIPH